MLVAKLPSEKRVVDVRAFTLNGPGGGDYHSQGKDHWIVGRIATPMSKYAEYRDTRTSWGIDALGTVVVEVEASDGQVGVGVSTGGAPAAYLVERHFARFVRGKAVNAIEVAWDQMFRASAYYGRKGLAVNAISAVDLAMWDLLGKVRGAPVYDLIGGKVRNEITFYATGPRPDLAQKMGFIGGKLPLVYSAADGEEGFRKNVERLAEARKLVGPDFWLMYDCWMSLDLPYAARLAKALAPQGLKWIEECFLPDDYWSYSELRRLVPPGVMVTTGEHEATALGFKLLLERGCADIIQPDVGWCGGLTELLRISKLADEAGVPVVPHGSSVYSYQYVITRPSSEFAEFLMMAPDAASVVPMFHPLFRDEPVPERGKLRLSAKPGFGVELNPSMELKRVRAE